MAVRLVLSVLKGETDLKKKKNSGAGREAEGRAKGQLGDEGDREVN